MNEKSQYRTRLCRIGNSEFIVSERVQVNPENSLALSALTFLLFILNTLQKNRQTLSQPKPWCNDSGVLNLHHGYYSTMIKEFLINTISVFGIF